MLTTGMEPDVGPYNFKSSPDSSTDDSFMSDYLDLHSDDFLQTLSSDLDIPLLLNSNDDKLGLFNSFLDRSPDEILSEVTPPGALLSNGSWNDLHFDVNQWKPSNLKAEVKSELFSSGSPTPSQTSTGSHSSDVKEELIIDTLPLSPNDSFSHLKASVPLQKSISPYVVPAPSRNRKSCVKEVLSPKRPKILKPSSIMPRSTSCDTTPSVVVIETIPTSVPQITIANNVPTYIPMPSSVGVSVNMDPKILKRQQRMIKNRESANLSRKKKKEYLASLEKQVQDLMSENKVLKIENAQLKEKLAKTCGNKIPMFPVKLPSKTVTKTMVLCAFLLTMGFNLDYLRSPLYNSESFVKSSDAVSKISNHHSRSLLWSPENEDVSTANTTESAQLLPMCPIYVNQSENVRLAQELHRWIGKPFNTSEEFYKENSITERPVKIKKARLRSKTRQNSLDTPILSSVYRLGRQARRVELISDNELQIYTPNIDHIYLEFFEAINRRDDTFYVVSFSPDHMLLPALHYNKTTRPKMSLIMPFMLPNDSVHSQSTEMPLMQIDCEVLNTRLIHVKYGAIPEHLRTPGNHTTETSYKHTGRNVSRSDSKRRNITSESYKPYFMQKRKAKSLLFKSEFEDGR